MRRHESTYGFSGTLGNIWFTTLFPSLRRLPVSIIWIRKVWFNSGKSLRMLVKVACSSYCFLDYTHCKRLFRSIGWSDWKANSIRVKVRLVLHTLCLMIRRAYLEPLFLNLLIENISQLMHQHALLWKQMTLHVFWFQPTKHTPYSYLDCKLFYITRNNRA